MPMCVCVGPMREKEIWPAKKYRDFFFIVSLCVCKGQNNTQSVRVHYAMVTVCRERRPFSSL